MEDNRSRKQQIRSELLERRRQLSREERAMQALQLGAQIAAFLDAKNLPDKLVVATYKGMKEELDPAPATAVFYAMGATVCYPCTYADSTMDFVALTPRQLDEEPPSFIAKPGRFATKEDVKGLVVVPPERIDLMLVPGVGFDKARNRMGYGAGCYDRYLPLMRDDAPKIGVCYDCQLVEELPVEDTDRPLDVIITPSIAF